MATTEQREALTIRFPIEVLARARGVKEDRESLNDLVVGAVEREVRRREVLRVLAEIDRIREQIVARTGLQPSSVPLIRELREGIGRRD
ncbi:MAG: hypothetical protein HY690_01550 [Chloroflexi bacterium]|nr:hypothetical protein [Chloroflexota bacterium]